MNILGNRYEEAGNAILGLIPKDSPVYEGDTHDRLLKEIPEMVERVQSGEHTPDQYFDLLDLIYIGKIWADYIWKKE